MNKIAGFVLFLVILLHSSCRISEDRLATRADKIHRKILTIDSHCDTPLNMIRNDYDLGVRNDNGCVDFPRMKEGGLDAEFFVVFIGQGPRNDSAFSSVNMRADEIFRTIRANIEKNSNISGLACSPDEAYRLKNEGKRAAFIGLENGYAIGLDRTRLKHYYDLGARYMTLCHSMNNDICDSSTDCAGPEHDGLSSFGLQVVEEMNRLGMIIDVSHISDNAFYDVIHESKAPVIASHSSCRALCEHHRNCTDDMLLALKENGGVIQICIVSEYLKTPVPNPELESKINDLTTRWGNPDTLNSEDRKKFRTEFQEIKETYTRLATVSDVVDHIDHVVQVSGIDHVGIGTDFDGGGRVEGCVDVSQMKNITIELLRRGYSRSDIAKIWGGNFIRVFNEVQKIKDS